MNSQDDLVTKAVAGDQQAFAELTDPLRNQLWMMCLRVTGNADDAADALQEALLAIWRGLPRFRRDAALSSWAYRIAANAALAVATAKRPTPIENAPDMAAIRLNAPVRRPPVDDEVVDRDAVRRALAQVPAQFRQALVLREVGDLSYAEIAAHQGVPVQTVRSRISRARTMLRTTLAEHARH